MGEHATRMAFSILARKPIWRSRLGRSRWGYKNNIITDLNEVGCTNTYIC